MIPGAANVVSRRITGCCHLANLIAYDPNIITKIVRRLHNDSCNRFRHRRTVKTFLCFFCYSCHVFYVLNVFKNIFQRFFIIKTLAKNSTARNSKNVRKYFLRLELCSIGHCTLKCTQTYCKKGNVAEMSILTLLLMSCCFCT